ncbi:MAG: O-antigen ligase family protein [Candidatus Yonathbacteria bacterium]|nr:O-antigen ligase family protein [Candidatus Yonathbacteria bacterium]
MNIHKILANAVVLAGFLAVPFIPFIILGDTTFFPFIVGKNFAFRIVVEIMFSAWLVLAFIDPTYRPKKSYLLGVFAAFISIITMAAIFGENPAKSFWSNFERMEGVVTYFHLFAYFIVATTVLTARGFWRPYLNFNLGVGVIMALYGVMQWAGALEVVQDGIRINGTLGNAEYLSTYALFNIFLAGFFIVRQSFTTAGERARVAIYGAIILIQTFVLYHAGTRGATLGLLAGLGLATFLVAIFERNNKAVQKGAIGVLLAIVIFVGGFVALRDASFIQNSPVLSRLAAISPSEGTGKARLMVWGMAIEGFKERPILGWGMDNFNYVFNKYYDPNMWGQEQWFDRAHNVFFDWLIAGGALGLFGYLSLFGCAIYCIWRRADELSIVEKSVFTGLLGGYFFQNLFVFDNISSLIYFGTILAYIESMSHREIESKKPQGKLKAGAEEEDLTFIVSGGAVILALVLIYTVNYNGYMQNTTLIRALSERSEIGASYNLGLFKDAIGYNSFGTAEIREQLASFSMNAFDQSKGISDMQKQFLALAGSEIEKQVTELPRDARHQLFAGSFLAKTGEIDKGITYLTKALELSPTKQTILFELGSAYYGKKDTVKTEEIFKRAFELAPEFETAEKYYLQILMVNGKRAEAEKILKAHPIPNVSL